MMARIRKSLDEKEKGFTLIELLVVIIIIGILSAIAIPVFLNQRQKAVDASTKSDMRTVATEIETYFTESQAYPATITTATPGQVTVGTGAVTILSAGTVITYSLGTVLTDYCITGSNANGSTGTTKTFKWRSETGGLVAGASTAASCPTT